jgi:WD40 repeat protein
MSPGWVRSSLPSVLVWDRSSSQAHALANARVQSRFTSLGFYPDSMRLAFLSDEAKIAVWDVPTKQKAFSCGNRKPQRWLGCLSADGAWYAVGGKIWDMAARKFRVALPVELSVVRSVARSPQAERLASISTRAVLPLLPVGILE